MDVESEPEPPARRMNPVLPRKLQHVYSKHADDFGIADAWNPENGVAFERVLQDHVNDPAIKRIIGTYRGTVDVTHYYNPTNYLNVMIDESDDLVSAWKLSLRQVEHLLDSGNIQ